MVKAGTLAHLLQPKSGKAGSWDLSGNEHIYTTLLHSV
jgi:hypothetical protein